jgi:nucleoside-diphosphate-sugar epimerase
MKILVTGGCGYKGSVLVPKLLSAGHQVVAFDIMWFGNHLTPHPHLEVVCGDVRESTAVELEGIDAIIHLSSVANDPCGDLDPKLTWEVSCLGDDAACRQGRPPRHPSFYLCVLRAASTASRTSLRY